MSRPLLIPALEASHVGALSRLIGFPAARHHVQEWTASCKSDWWSQWTGIFFQFC